MIAIEDEFSAAVCSLTPARVNVLRGAGIPERAIFHDPLLVGMAPIQRHKGGLYDLDATADAWAVLLPCGIWDGLNWRLEDIVAFHLGKPERWWCRRGTADVLGVVNGFFVESRRLHRRPIDWLKDEGRGKTHASRRPGYESRRGERLAVAADCPIRLFHRLFNRWRSLFCYATVTAAKLLPMIFEHF